MWTRLRQQQQRGAQLGARPGKARKPGEAPAEATKDRAAQEHDAADRQVAPDEAGKAPVYPAGRLKDERGDNTPSAPLDPRVEWDDVVQPYGARDEDEPPEGK